MKLNLEKDLVFFDIESTGADVVKDRIIQIAMIKYTKEGTEPIELNLLMNPEYEIKPDAIKVHGITPEMVQDKPSFKEYALEIYDFLEDCDLAGYNCNRFDIPMLIEEFARVGMNFSMEGRSRIDALQIFYKMEPRTLKAALKFYCGQSLENAHDAMADTKATAAVFMGQLDMYEGVDYIDQDDQLIKAPIKNDIKAIHEFLDDNKNVDFTGRFSRNKEGIIVFNFGTNKGQEAYKNPQTLKWIINKDFPEQVKNIARAILNGKMK